MMKITSLLHRMVLSFLLCSFAPNLFAQISGCTDAAACNYNPEATSESGSCLYVGQACNDGNLCTINTFIDENCDCIALDMVNCDDGNPCTLNECDPITGCFTINLPDSDNDGVCDAEDTCPSVPGIIGAPCDDGDPCTFNDIIDENCNCSGTLIVCPPPAGCGFSQCDSNTGLCVTVILPDADNDGICDDVDSCPNTPGEIGQACNDGNLCTYNTFIDENCDCVALDTIDCDDGNPCTLNGCDPLTGCFTVILPDSDGDGICDAEEVNTYNSDPFVQDTDGDGLTDGLEVNESGTDPTLVDTDGDNCNDNLEYSHQCPDSPICTDCPGDFNMDNVINTGDLLFFLGVLGSLCD